MKERPVTLDTRFLTTVIYGASGVGKTTLAATAPQPLFLDSNKGLLPIAGVRAFAHVMAVDVNRTADLDATYDNFTGTGKRSWHKRFKTVIFDHFDDIQGLVLDELGERAASKDDRRDPDEISQREYGIMGTRLRRYIRKFKKVRVHKILICGEMEDRETGRMRPSLVGALKNQLPYYVDHTLYYRIGKKGARYLHLDATDEFYAKTRARWLPPEARRWRVAEDDYTFLTRLFALIAAGPKSARSADRGK